MKHTAYKEANLVSSNWDDLDEELDGHLSDLEDEDSESSFWSHRERQGQLAGCDRGAHVETYLSTKLPRLS